MPLLVDDLSVWDISFRWGGHDPDRLWLAFLFERYQQLTSLLPVISAKKSRKRNA